MTKFTAINIKVGRGTAVHYAWATNRNGEPIERVRAFCGADGAGGGNVRGYDLGVSGITEAPVTCKKCLKGMEQAQEIFAKEAAEVITCTTCSEVLTQNHGCPCAA